MPLFLLITPPPTTSTLFPYTTLFRSLVQVLERRDQSLPVGARSGGSLASSVDRKSTRLNSSHVAISYAVFCLKKKNDDAPGMLYTDATSCGPGECMAGRYQCGVVGLR